MFAKYLRWLSCLLFICFLPLTAWAQTLPDPHLTPVAFFLMLRWLKSVSPDGLVSTARFPSPCARRFIANMVPARVNSTI
jgi:hypothetical protein